MKDTVQHKDAYGRMKPGIITAQGFLGTDERPLAEIIQEDEEAFQRLGLVFEMVAARLEELRDAGGRGLGEPVTIEGKWLVMNGDARGVLPCPFDDGVHHKNGIMVKRLDSGESIVYSDLSLHLLRVHHFCQGKGSPFRLDPTVLARVLTDSAIE